MAKDDKYKRLRLHGTIERDQEGRLLCDLNVKDFDASYDYATERVFSHEVRSINEELTEKDIKRFCESLQESLISFLKLEDKLIGNDEECVRIATSRVGDHPPVVRSIAKQYFNFFNREPENG